MLELGFTSTTVALGAFLGGSRRVRCVVRVILVVKMLTGREGATRNNGLRKRSEVLDVS